MTDWYIYPSAYLLGIVFNLNPSCGSASMVWSSSLSNTRLVTTLAFLRILVLALLGAVAASLGTALRLPWGILMLLTAAYLAYITFVQLRRNRSCRLPNQGSGLPWMLAVTPPPSGYIGLALFFGGFHPPTPLVGASVLALIGLGLTTPVWLMIVNRQWWQEWQRRMAMGTKLNRARIVFQFVGVLIFTLVGLAFVLVKGFHRPLLELTQ